MFHALVIIIHRPFVSEGHLQSIVGSTATAAFSLCSRAANGIDAVLNLYRQHFCFKNCPYFLSYAAYVSGTIHVRIAAQSQAGSKAHVALRNCLEILEEQQDLCHAPRQSLKILLSLVRRLNVNAGLRFKVKASRAEAINGNVENRLPYEASESSSPEQEPMIPTDDYMDLDINAVLESFNLHPRPSKNVPQPAIAQGDGNLGFGGFDFGDVSSMDYNAFLDPVFGVDALLSDPDRISAFEESARRDCLSLTD